MIWETTTAPMTCIELEDTGDGITLLIDFGAKYEYAEATLTKQQVISMARAILDYLGD